MNKLAIVICNFNKEKYIVNCIKSIFESNANNFDIYVVDNASIDDSVRTIKENFGNKINLIINKENVGGSGGFNTGIKEALKQEYKYMMLLDNDVVLDKDAIDESILYLENNNDVAIVGSKLYSMDNPNQIQEMGANIDFENYSIKPFYKGFIDNEHISEVVQCDYVPACAMVIRVEALKVIGLMNEENFIYWDDIEWGYRYKLKGYKIIALGKSKVFHKMGVKNNETTFGTYYFWRNRVKFFMNYCNEKQKADFAKIIFDEMFQSIYMCNYIGKYSSAITIFTAVLDALYGKYGKADEDKIMKVETIKDILKESVFWKKYIYITPNFSVESIRKIINKIEQIDDKIKIFIESNSSTLMHQFGRKYFEYDEMNLPKEEFLRIKVCDHILEEKIYDEKFDIIIDKYFNVIKSEKDQEYILNYEHEKNMLKNIVYPIILNSLKRGEK